MDACESGREGEDIVGWGRGDIIKGRAGVFGNSNHPCATAARARARARAASELQKRGRIIEAQGFARPDSVVGRCQV